MYIILFILYILYIYIYILYCNINYLPDERDIVKLIVVN